MLGAAGLLCVAWQVDVLCLWVLAPGVAWGLRCADPVARLAALAVAGGCLRTVKTLGFGVFPSASGGCGRDGPVVKLPCGKIHSAACHRLLLSCHFLAV